MTESFENRLIAQEEALRRGDDRPFREILTERAMPRPLWAQRPMTDTGDRLTDAVKTAAAGSAADTFCIYAHVPYCRTRCGYCDCYSFPLTPSRIPELPVYTDLLCREAAWWGEHVPELGSRRLSTVHFGGGTPLMIGTEGLGRVMDAIRDFFKVDDETELALESTSSDLNKNVLDGLWKIGFTRLHVGVQTLSDPIRKAIGRHESGDAVLEKLRYAVESGWTVSTDVIIGLPGYTEAEIRPDIEKMAAVGVEGFSIYELVRSPRNRAFFEHHGIADPDLEAMWRQFQYAFWLAEDLGYRHRIYNHMAKGRDDNRYFTSPARGEDLLSFGTIADGYFGNYLYRHGELPEYRESIGAGGPGLDGGLCRTKEECRYASLEREIRGGNPLPDPFIEILGPEKALDLFRNWIAKGYLRVDDDGEGTELLANGSWFVQKMLTDIVMSY
ncbi:MAG: radical SAM protein [Flexilinea sp.]|nr:radical SAM protein [Flexilinea sp.]